MYRIYCSCLIFVVCTEGRYDYAHITLKSRNPVLCVTNFWMLHHQNLFSEVLLIFMRLSIMCQQCTKPSSLSSTHILETGSVLQITGLVNICVDESSILISDLIKKDITKMYRCDCFTTKMHSAVPNMLAIKCYQNVYTKPRHS